MCRLAPRLRTDTELDHSREIRDTGIATLIGAPSAMTAGLSLSGITVAHQVGSRSRIAPSVMAISTTAALALFGSRVVEVIPKLAFATMLCNIAMSLLLDQLLRAWRSYRAREFVLVLLHVALTASCGMAYAVALGLLFTSLIFIFEYSQHSGVLQSATAELEHSKVHRSAAAQRVLEARGASVLVIHLHGMLFFGSAYSVVEEVRSHLAALEQLGQELRCLVLDFDRCSALDSSAVAVLQQARRYTKRAALVIANASEQMLRMLHRQDVDFDQFETMDLALEHCENLLLADAAAAGEAPGELMADALGAGARAAAAAPSGAALTASRLKESSPAEVAGSHASASVCPPLPTMAKGLEQRSLTPAQARRHLPADVLAGIRRRL
eukprot:6445646-Prymnesium_polylepis.1